MTQKELLYMEDAICHEESIIGILNDSISKCSDDIASYFQNEMVTHQEMKDLLVTKLKEKANG